MLLTKIRNGVELTWDSLDSQERQIVLYALVYATIWICGSLLRLAHTRERDRLKRELRDELTAAADAVPG